MGSATSVSDARFTCFFLTANTKGNKRSRTRNDSYTAGQSVGESGDPSFLLNNARMCHKPASWLYLCRGPWGYRPGRDHAQETGEHCTRVHPLVQWVTHSARVLHHLWLWHVALQLSQVTVTTAMQLPGSENLLLLLKYPFFSFLVGDGLVQPEALNKKAIQIINRVRDKLTGEFCCPTQTFDEKHSAVQLNQIVFKCRTRLFPRWHAGCAHTSGAPHQTGHIPRKPVPVLHRMVSNHATLPLLFFPGSRDQ